MTTSNQALRVRFFFLPQCFFDTCKHVNEPRCVSQRVQFFPYFPHILLSFGTPSTLPGDSRRSRSYRNRTADRHTHAVTQVLVRVRSICFSCWRLRKISRKMAHDQGTGVVRKCSYHCRLPAFHSLRFFATSCGIAATTPNGSWHHQRQKCLRGTGLGAQRHRGRRRYRVGADHQMYGR